MKVSKDALVFYENKTLGRLFVNFCWFIGLFKFTPIVIFSREWELYSPIKLSEVITKDYFLKDCCS